jgi:hypothetical protein
MTGMLFLVHASPYVFSFYSKVLPKEKQLKYLAEKSSQTLSLVPLVSLTL